MANGRCVFYTLQEKRVISALLREIMTAKGLKQADLAEVLEISLDRVKGLTSGRIAKLAPDEIRLLVQRLNVSADYLATGTGPVFQLSRDLTFVLTQGERLRQERERLGWTQAFAASSTGIDLGKWERFENGTARPEPGMLVAMSEAGIDIAYVLTGQTPALRAKLGRIKVVADALSTLQSGEEMEVLAARLGLEWLSGAEANARDESELISNYRRCSPPDQKTIRQMALRFAGDAPTETKARRK